MAFYGDGSLLGNDDTAPYGWIWSGAALGSHTLKAIAWDNEGQATTSAVVNIDVTLSDFPEVSITTPAEGTTVWVGTEIAIEASATDDGTVTNVAFYADGSLLGNDATAPYGWIWSGAALGGHTLKAIAWDNDRQSTTSTVVNIVVAPSPRGATGGNTIIDIGGYRVHTFTNSGTFTVTSGGLVEVLLVAGGGGAGAGTGGGGAGGVLLVSTNLSNGSVSVTIGAGGAGAGRFTNGSNGDPSAFGYFTAAGGGGGASAVGLNGGSGGGGGPNYVGGVATPTGQGHNGGKGALGLDYPGGGGGGAGAVGADAPDQRTGGDGGAGLQSDISGVLLPYAGGGGRGYTRRNSNSRNGRHWRGAGGAGDAAGQNGTSNTGGGAGAGGGSTIATGNGGSGGSGIVIVRYPLEPQTVMIIR